VEVGNLRSTYHHFTSIFCITSYSVHPVYPVKHFSKIERSNFNQGPNTICLVPSTAFLKPDGLRLEPCARRIRHQRFNRIALARMDQSLGTSMVTVAV
jgi:hypothetical protein